MFGVCLRVLDLILCVLSLVCNGNRNHLTALSSVCVVFGVGVSVWLKYGHVHCCELSVDAG